MGTIQQPKCIKLFNNKKLKLQNHESVFSVLKKCAHLVDISRDSFQLFRLVQKKTIILPQRKKLPAYLAHAQPIYYRVIDFSFDINLFCLRDPSLKTYLYHQIMHDIFEDPNPKVSRDLIEELLILDIIRLTKVICSVNIDSAYDLYFVIFDNLVVYKTPDLAKKTKNFYKVNEGITETQCTLEFIILYANKIHSVLQLLKNCFHIRSPSFQSFNRQKLNEKLFMTVSKDKLIITAREDNDYSIKLNMSEINQIHMCEKNSVVLLYGDTRSHVSLTFKNLKHVDTFVSLCQCYYFPINSSRLLVTKYFDIKVAESSVIYNHDEKYNLIQRNPMVSYFSSYDLAEQCLHKIGKSSGWFMITAISNASRPCFFLSYSIQKMVKRTRIHNKEGLLQIGTSVNDNQKRFSDITDMVNSISPSIDGEKQKLLYSLTDHMIIDILTVDDFLLNIPQTFIRLIQPPMMVTWCYKVLSGTFEDFSGNKMPLKFLEFNENVHKDVSRITKSLQHLSDDCIVKYSGMCKIGTYNKTVVMLDFGNSYQLLQDFLENTNDISYISSLRIGHFVGNALMWLNSKGITHGCPSSSNILICQSSLQIKLFNIGLTKSLFSRADWENNPFLQKPLCKSAKNDLRWLPADVLTGAESPNSPFVDRWVFGCTLWQIFNNGKLPLYEHSDEELIDRYKAIRSYHIAANDGVVNLPAPVLWFWTELVMPNQRKVLNAKLQRLINRILYNQNDEVDELEEIVELYNKYIYPPESEPDFYEDLKDNTDLIIRKQGGKLIFEEQILEENLLNFYCSDGDFSHLEDSDSDSYDEGFGCKGTPLNDVSGDDYSVDFTGNSLDAESSKNYSNIQNENILLDDAFVDMSCMSYNPALLAELSLFSSNVWDASTYTLGEVIGRGNFGTVQKATLHEGTSLPEAFHGAEVAVKIFHINNMLGMDANTIFTEAKSMSSLNHERIVPFLGISLQDSIEGQYIHIIMPFYKLGSLKVYIRNFLNTIKTERLISFGLQIAEGMEYLNNKGFVHRDLALRNILVEQPNKIRIADLGLCREVSTDYYYILQSSGSTGLPYLYYPLEFFEKLKFDQFCDVWSYGVTCYEMFSLGQTPYKAQGIKNKDMLIEYLKSGRTLEIPQKTPSLFDYIMKRCWMQKKERWTFSEIVIYIRSNVTYHNPFVKIKRCDYEKIQARDDIITEVLVEGGQYKVDRISTRYINNIKRFTLEDNIGKLEGDILEYPNRDIPYDKLQRRKYKVKYDSVKSLLKLCHWNIGQIVGYLVEEDTLYTFGPYMCLGNLNEFCSQSSNQLKVEKKYLFLKQTLDAMLFLFSSNIVHGSLNLDNVFLQTKDRVVLYDVGMKTLYGLEDYYWLRILPPEALKVVKSDDGCFEATLLSDTWMFGMLMWEMFSPCQPYLNIKESAEDMDEFASNLDEFLTNEKLELPPRCPFAVRKAIDLCFLPLANRKYLDCIESCFINIT